MHRSNKGIPSTATHKLLFSWAAELSNVVALDDEKPHTLPLGISFFRVNDSVVDGKNIQVLFLSWLFNISAHMPLISHQLISQLINLLSYSQLLLLTSLFKMHTRILLIRLLHLSIQIVSLRSLCPSTMLPPWLVPIPRLTSIYPLKTATSTLPWSNFFVLPPWVRGSNAYFNEGRINENNHLQLQAFPFIHAKQLNSIDLLRAGLGLHSFIPQSNPSNRDAVDDTASTATTKPDLWAKVDATFKDKISKTIVLKFWTKSHLNDQRDTLYAFKLLLMALLSSMRLSPMEGRSKNQTKRLHLQTWQETSIHLSNEQQHKQAPVSLSVGKWGNWEMHWLRFLACSCLVN